MFSPRTQTKTILHAVTLAAAIMGTGTLKAQPTRILFTDNFTPGPSALWNNYAGQWTAAGGQYYAQVPTDSPLTYTGLPFVFTDFTLTVTTIAGDGGIWLRSDANSPYKDYLLLVIGGNGYGVGDRGGTAGTSIYFATASDSIINEVDNVITPGGTYTITVTARGDTYSVYLNASATPVATLVDSRFPVGQVGLYDDQPNTVTGNGFGTPTTYTDFLLRGTAVPPGISLFEPGSGEVGTEVKITGRNLQFATAVTFNGTAAKFTQHYPSTDIIATVPDLATTGPIEVITPVGKAAGARSFTVVP